MDTAKPLRIVIVDDHPLVRDGMRSRLSTQEAWTVCGEAEMPSEAMRVVRETSPDLVIVDLSLKDGNGLDLIKQIAALPNPPRTLVCSMHDENMYAQRAIQAGASGFLHKQKASEQLMPAIFKILEGKLFVSDEIMQRVVGRLLHDPEAPQDPIEQLTDRELQVFESLGRGMSVAQIASALFLSTKTIETYRERTKRKLNLRTSAELLRYAVQWTTQHGAN
jgi:DNA-binding NarL/FixJ family response regulator